MYDQNETDKFREERLLRRSGDGIAYTGKPWETPDTPDLLHFSVSRRLAGAPSLRHGPFYQPVSTEETVPPLPHRSEPVLSGTEHQHY